MNRIMEIPGFHTVEEKQNPAFIKVIKAFKNWKEEILNSYIFFLAI